MVIDAIVLAGGRATRLGGTSKAGLLVDGQSMLQHALAALSGVRHIVVVGDDADIHAAAPDASITTVREVPAFAGPAAAIAAGLDALDVASDFVIVIGCDMPAVRDAIVALLGAVRAGTDGAVAVSSDGRTQQLVAVYSTPALAGCVTRHRGAGDLENLSVHALLSSLDPALVPVPDGSTDDVDTWADAARLGVLIPQPSPTKD